MKRLTERSLDYCTQHCPSEKMISCAFYKDGQAERCWLANMYDRLAAYEDTGTEPEEVLSALEMSKIFAALEELKEYQKAEQEGRLVVLPCKYSPVWIVEEATNNCDTVSDKDCMSRPNCEGCPALKSYVRRVDEFYLTREEAEKALKGVSEGA